MGFYDQPDKLIQPTVTRADPPAPVQPTPRDQWPLAAKALAKLAKPTDTGLGDVVERLAAGVGGRAYKRLAKRLGYDCGCGARQAALNARYPM